MNNVQEQSIKSLESIVTILSVDDRDYLIDVWTRFPDLVYAFIRIGPLGDQDAKFYLTLADVERNAPREYLGLLIACSECEELTAEEREEFKLKKEELT